MKKPIIILLSIILLFIIGGCSIGVPQAQYDRVVSERNALKSQLEALGVEPSITSSVIPSQENTSSKKASIKFDANMALSQISVEEFSYSTDFWNYGFLVIKNNSGFDINISVNVDFYNGDALVATKSDEEEAFESGTEIILYFMPDENFTIMKYEISVSEEKWYDCVISDLKYDTTEAQDKIILSVTNNGQEPADFVEGSVLFFSGEKVVGFAQNYFTDDDSEIKPGKTIKQEMNCYESFDRIRVFLSGRR